MKKGEKTKEQIIQNSAILFNIQGYSGVSLNDITDVTGIKRGGIYRHFNSKEDIAIEAFHYASSVVFQQFKTTLRSKETAFDKLMSLFEVYENVVDDPPFIGGCPLLNTAVEHDDGHHPLRSKANESLHDLIKLIQEILDEGILNNEFIKDFEKDSFTSYFISSLEGGIMLSKLDGNNDHIRHCKEHMSKYVEQFISRNKI